MRTYRRDPKRERDPKQNFLPHPMANSLTAVKPFPDTLPPGVVFGLLCVYAMVALAAGSWALARRDARPPSAPGQSVCTLIYQSVSYGELI